jgi:uncharacterized protein
MSPLARILRAFVRAYRWSWSAVMGRQCRFLPTCSEYAEEALAAHGALKGTWLAMKRVCRCHPWGGAGLDPVPQPGDVSARRLGRAERLPPATP